MEIDAASVYDIAAAMVVLVPAGLACMVYMPGKEEITKVVNALATLDVDVQIVTQHGGMEPRVARTTTR